MRRGTCSSTLAMFSPRPRGDPRPSDALAQPNPQISSPSFQPYSLHWWRRPVDHFPTSIPDSRPCNPNPPSVPLYCFGVSLLGCHYTWQRPRSPQRAAFYVHTGPHPLAGPHRHPHTRASFPPSPRPRPPDYRSWIPTRPGPSPPPCSGLFRVLSYNILADYLAREHRSKLYFHIPMHILDWEWRKRRIFLEFGLWSADIICLQEVDRFPDIQEELAARGYHGIWKMRTGVAVDGCAMFWRASRFRLRHEENIEFYKLGLRDNIAQICVLESQSHESDGSKFAANLSGMGPINCRDPNLVVVCNIHVLYNPKRGDIKLGQVRVLIDRAFNVSRQWNCAPVIICGDFNSIPKSPLYNFISEQKLDLSRIQRDQVSGQHSCVQVYRGDDFTRANFPQQSNTVKASTPKASVGISKEHEASDGAEVCASLSDTTSDGHMRVASVKCWNNKEITVESPVPLGQLIDDRNCINSRLMQEQTTNSNGHHNSPTEEHVLLEQDTEQHHQDSISFAMSHNIDKYDEQISDYHHEKISDPNFLAELHGEKSTDELIEEGTNMLHNNLRVAFNSSPGLVGSPICDYSWWTPEEIEAATGDAGCLLLEHKLQLKSAYTEVKDSDRITNSNGEPDVTSYNRKFMGTVDYIWFSEGLQTVKVLETIPKHVLQRSPGFPTPKWGSDHIAIACEFAFTETTVKGT